MALKMMKRNRTSERIFLLEFSVSFFLSSHPAIIGCYGTAFKTTEHFVFAQEPAPASDLLMMISPNEGVPEEAVKSCAVQISSAMEFISEKGLVHMDIKPENVLVFDEECRCVKLTDFGLTRVKGTLIRSKVGSVSYMAPEMCQMTVSEGLVVDSRLDTWAFGVVIYCLLTGESPWQVAMDNDEEYSRFVYWQNHFQTDDPPESWNKLPTGVLRMLNNLMAIDCNRRSLSSEVLNYLDERWKKSKETAEPTTSQGNGNGIKSISSTDPEKLSPEAPHSNAQNNSEISSGSSKSSMSIMSTLSSMSCLLSTDSSGKSQSGMTQRNDTPITVDEEISLAIGAEVEVG